MKARDGRATRTSRLLPLLVVGTLAALGISLAAFLSQSSAGRDEVLRELPKVTWQFMLVGVLGGFVAHLLQQAQARAAEEKEAERDRIASREAMDDFRVEMLRRVIAVTGAVRRVPLLVAARRSFKTYDEQMRAVIDAYLELRALRHEIDNLGKPNNAAFARWDEIRGALVGMERYLASLAEEFAGDESKAISELQVAAERDRRLQPDVWHRLSRLPVLGDMLAERPSGRAADARSPETVFYAEYMRPYGYAIGGMRAQVLAGPCAACRDHHGRPDEVHEMGTC